MIRMTGFMAALVTAIVFFTCGLRFSESEVRAGSRGVDPVNAGNRVTNPVQGTWYGKAAMSFDQFLLTVTFSGDTFLNYQYKGSWSQKRDEHVDFDATLVQSPSDIPSNKLTYKITSVWFDNAHGDTPLKAGDTFTCNFAPAKPYEEWSYVYRGTDAISLRWFET